MGGVIVIIIWCRGESGQWKGVSNSNKQCNKGSKNMYPKHGGGVLTHLETRAPPPISKCTAPSFHGSSRTAPLNCHFSVNLFVDLI